MHILHLADAIFRDRPGGSRRVALEVACMMESQGHRVTFLVPHLRPQLPPEECAGGLRVIRFTGAGLLERQRSLQCAVRSLHTENPIDAAFVHFAYTALGYHRMPLSQEIPTVRVFHGPWDREAAAEREATVKTRLACQVMFAMDKYSLHRSHRVVALSEFMARDVIERFRVPAKRVSVIPGGVNVDEFQPGDKAEARQRLGLPPDAVIVFTARRLVRRMGLDRLIEAAALARKDILNLRVVIGGKGPLREELEGLVERRELGKCVQLIGFIPDAQFADYYRAADVFVLPTVALEGFGLIILESLACNTPVLGTPVGAIPEVLSAFGSDLVLPGTSPEDIAAGLVQFAKNRIAYQKDYRATVAAHFTWERMAEHLLEDCNTRRFAADH